jgi:hypothetical protein
MGRVKTEGAGGSKGLTTKVQCSGWAIWDPHGIYDFHSHIQLLPILHIMGRVKADVLGGSKSITKIVQDGLFGTP